MTTRILIMWEIHLNFVKNCYVMLLIDHKSQEFLTIHDSYLEGSKQPFNASKNPIRDPRRSPRAHIPSYRPTGIFPYKNKRYNNRRYRSWGRHESTPRKGLEPSEQKCVNQFRDNKSCALVTPPSQYDPARLCILWISSARDDDQIFARWTRAVPRGHLKLH